MHSKNTEKWPSIKDYKQPKSTKVKPYKTPRGTEMMPHVYGPRKGYNV